MANWLTGLVAWAWPSGRKRPFDEHDSAYQQLTLKFEASASPDEAGAALHVSKRLKRPPTPWTAEEGKGRQARTCEQGCQAEAGIGRASGAIPQHLPIQAGKLLRGLLTDGTQVLRALAFLSIFDLLPLVGGVHATLAAMLVLITRARCCEFDNDNLLLATLATIEQYNSQYRDMLQCATDYLSECPSEDALTADSGTRQADGARALARMLAKHQINLLKACHWVVHITNEEIQAATSALGYHEQLLQEVTSKILDFGEQHMEALADEGDDNESCLTATL